jgi:uncharacterized repeat protein (TIGR03803 family)
MRSASSVLVLALVLGASSSAVQSAQAQTYTETVLYAFTGGSDGIEPMAPVVRDPAGNLYGTSFQGTSGVGLVFKLQTNGQFTVLHSFTDTPDGALPSSGLIRDSAGNLYGETSGGGTFGFGTVYKVDTAGTETVFYSFTGHSDGNGPSGGLVRDAAGNLYGTAGGGTGNGVVFKLNTTGNETVLYNFTSDESGPYPGLVLNSTGNLYGTSQSGGDTSCNAPYGCGTVFEVSKAGTGSVLYAFKGQPDGSDSIGGVILGKTGNLYGTTKTGGTPENRGTVYEVKHTKSDWTERVVHRFQLNQGLHPTCNLLMDSAGNLYGTTNQGGAHGEGTVFRVDNTGTEVLLYSFFGRSDGGFPVAGVIRDTTGNLYGTTKYGGNTGKKCGGTGCGTVFKLAPN